MAALHEHDEEIQISANSDESSTSPIQGVTKEDVRRYFSEVTCNLRVLGSQLGLKPYELDDLSLREQSDPRQILVDECFNKDKIMSWQQLVDVLERPALNQGAIAEKIRGKFLRQSSLESAASSGISSLHSPDPLSPMEISGRQITLPDAVNFIMRLTNQELQTLGNNLRLDEARIKEIISRYYDLNEQHQRLMELWFRKESNPTWEKLHESMVFDGSYRRESSTSTASVPTTPCSRKESRMKSSNEKEIESRFVYLLDSIQSLLEINNVTGENVRQFLVRMFRRAGDCIPKTNKISDIFDSVTVNNLWSYDNHDVLEKLVERYLPDHVSEISEYENHLSGFYATTKLIDYIRAKNLKCYEEAPSEHSLDRYTTEHYRELTVILDIDNRLSQLSMMYVRDLWKSFVNRFNIPSLTAVIDKILEGSLQIVWLVLPHVADLICGAAKQSEEFFREHDIVFVAIDDHILYDARLAKGDEDTNSENYMEVSATHSVGDPALLLDDAPTHASESHQGGMLNEGEITTFKTRFIELQERTRAELVSLKKSVKVVHVKLSQALPPRIKSDFQKYVHLKRSRAQNNLDELFEDVREYCGSCFEYTLLQQIIYSNNCRASLKNAMEQYGRDIEHFKQNTTALAFFQCHGEQLISRKMLPKTYRKLTVKHAVNPTEYKLAAMDHFREDVQNHPNSKLSECTFHIFGITQSSVQVEWAFSDDFSYALIAFFCSKDGKELLQEHQVDVIKIDDTPINKSLFLIEAAASSHWDDIDALLLDREEYIDLNYSNKENGWTALFYLAAGGKVPQVQKLLTLGANPNIRDTDGQTAVMVAVEAGQLEVVQEFLKEGCEVNYQEKVHGGSVLHIAAEKGFAEIYELLSDPTVCEIDTTLKDKNGKTAQQIVEEKEQAAATSADSAVRTSRRGMFQRISDWWQKNTREIRLTRAVQSGSVADVQKALDEGANPNRIINRVTRRTPMLEACQRGHTEIAKLLLSRGADPNWRARDDWNALVLASRNGHVETVALLLSWNPSCRDIVNVKAGYYGWTPLHTTCYYTGLELAFTEKDKFLERLKKVTELLLDNGADATITDNNGETPLTLVSELGYSVLADLIISKTPVEKRKLLLDYKKKNSWTALLLSSKQGHEKIVKSLLDAGASMSETNKDEMNAIHVGVSSGHVKVVEELASRADLPLINAVDKHGHTPLILATKLKNARLIEVLHEHGADVNIQTKEKKTALMYAAKLNSIALIKLLLQYSADLLATDSNQQTARTLATDKEVQKFLDKLIKERQERQQLTT